MLAKVRLALAVPAALGVKVKVKGADWPAAMVFGNVIPESANSLLLTVADETVTDALVALKVPLREALAPTTTLPKLRVAGETDSCPGAAPVPESAMFNGELEASDARASVALTAPADAGVKVTVKVTLPLVVRVAGKVRPLTEKLAFEMLACEILTVVPPVLVTVSDRLVFLPTVTLPKLRLAGEPVS